MYLRATHLVLVIEGLELGGKREAIDNGAKSGKRENSSGAHIEWISRLMKTDE